MSTNSSIMSIYDKVTSTIEALFFCVKDEQVETVFANAEITDPKEKIDLLQKCMGVEETFGTKEDISDNDEYEFEKAVFLEGSWRLLN